MKLKNIFWTVLTFFTCMSVMVACEGEDDGRGKIDDPDDTNFGLVDLTNDMFNEKVFDLTTDPEMKNFLGDRPVFIDFGATWCSNCHAMHPLIEKLAAKYGSGMDFYYADQDASSEVHAAFAAYFERSTMPLPCYITIDKDGKISDLYEGMMSEKVLSELIEKVLGGVPETNPGLVDLTSDMFNKKVFDLTADSKMEKFLGDRPVFIDFGATWCSNCHAMHPLIEKLAAKYGADMDFYYADQDECTDVHAAFAAYFERSTMPLPCYITISKDGKISDLYEGMMSEKVLSDLIEQVLK